MTETPMSGRRAQAARNDERILDAAREVFVADPGAPISAVAERAGVGISALYRRHEGKEELLATLCHRGLLTYVEIAERSLTAPDPWDGFHQFLTDVVVADTHALTSALSGTFTPTSEMTELASRAAELTALLVTRAQRAGVLRADVVAEDLGVLFGQLSAVRGGDDQRTGELRARFLGLLGDALRVPAEQQPLPGPAPRPGEFRGRWYRRQA